MGFNPCLLMGRRKSLVCTQNGECFVSKAKQKENYNFGFVLRVIKENIHIYRNSCTCITE